MAKYTGKGSFVSATPQRIRGKLAGRQAGREGVVAPAAPAVGGWCLIPLNIIPRCKYRNAMRIILLIAPVSEFMPPPIQMVIHVRKALMITPWTKEKD